MTDTLHYLKILFVGDLVSAEIEGAQHVSLLWCWLAGYRSHRGARQRHLEFPGGNAAPGRRITNSWRRPSPTMVRSIVSKGTIPSSITFTFTAQKSYRNRRQLPISQLTLSVPKARLFYQVKGDRARCRSLPSGRLLIMRSISVCKAHK